MLYEGLEWEEQLELEEWWGPPFLADLVAFVAAGLAKCDDLVLVGVLNPVLS